MQSVLSDHLPFLLLASGGAEDEAISLVPGSDLGAALMKQAAGA